MAGRPDQGSGTGWPLCPAAAGRRDRSANAAGQDSCAAGDVAGHRSTGRRGTERCRQAGRAGPRLQAADRH